MMYCEYDKTHKFTLYLSYCYYWGYYGCKIVHTLGFGWGLCCTGEGGFFFGLALCLGAAFWLVAACWMGGVGWIDSCWLDEAWCMCGATWDMIGGCMDASCCKCAM